VAIRPDPERYERIRNLLKAAHDHLHKRLHEAGQKH
jgi:hypothetical protein